MKKSIFIISGIIMLITYSASCQITLENEYSESVAFAYLEGENYYTLDFENNQCVIYDLNHSLVKSVNITVPADWYLNDVAFISTKIFNDDNLYELLVVFYKYELINDTIGYYEYTTKVINENGSELLSVPGAGFSDIFTTSDGETKLAVYIYDFSVYPYIYNTNIYSIPGEPVSSGDEAQSVILQDAYPNPSGSFVNIPYKLNNNKGGELVVSDMNGRIIKRLPVENMAGKFLLNTNYLARGQYLYHIQSHNGRSPAKKLIVK